MRIGATITRSRINCHLDDDEYVEVFPQTVHDIEITRAIPCEHKTCSHQPVSVGQSPLLVRKSYWLSDRSDDQPIRSDAEREGDTMSVLTG